jgi:hypothetical protein
MYDRGTLLSIPSLHQILTKGLFVKQGKQGSPMSLANRIGKIVAKVAEFDYIIYNFQLFSPRWGRRYGQKPVF